VKLPAMRVRPCAVTCLASLAVALGLAACVAVDEAARPDTPLQLTGVEGFPDPPEYVPDTEAQVARALRHLNGDGVPRDTARAVALLNEAAANGSARAAFLIGRLVAACAYLGITPTFNRDLADDAISPLCVAPT